MSGRGAARYRFGPVGLEVRSDDPDAARWLDEFATPWLQRSSGSAEHRVRVRGSRFRFAELERAASSRETPPVACFHLDRELVWLPGWRDGDALCLHDERRGCFLRIGQRDVEIVAPPRHRTVRLPLLRTVRELAMTRLRARPDALDLHAAAFEIAGRAVLVLGPKRAGKTTLLLQALLGGRANLVANDRALALLDGGPARVHGVPTAVRIRRDTLAADPRLAGDDGAGERPLLYHRGERRENRPAAPGAPLTLSPSELARRLGVGCVADAPLAAVVCPRIDPGAAGFSLEPMEAAEAETAVREALYGPGDERPDTVFERRLGRAAPETTEAASARLAHKLPFLGCRLGPDAYVRRREERTLAEALRGLVREGGAAA